ncbi:MAG: RnfABCDGE type electron transport complex subunit B [Xanthomonadales bacterium]|nr:RnfABCDGE type electron transport complex subunit B [Xanthomonadales bacterium]
MPDATRIDAELPQTQCTRCGYPACRPYAEAIAEGTAPINRCPPGGAATIAALARLLNAPVLPLDPECGVEAPRQLAWIDEAICIGCTKCILACPVDAIVGAAKRMHTVIAEDCTGCELCIAPCPVDCIELHPDPRPDTLALPAGQRPESAEFRARFEAHQRREAARQAEQQAKIARKRRELLLSTASQTLSEAIARAKARRRGED